MLEIAPGVSVPPRVAANALAHARRTEFEFFMLRAAHELGIDLEGNWHLSAMYEWANRIAEGDLGRGMVNVPPRALKSVIFSEVLPAWLLGRDPGCKIICVSYNQGLAEDFARRTRKIMLAAWYKELFPRTRLAATPLHDLVTTAGGFRRATSVDGAITGIGADIIIVDDPLKADDAESETRRASTNAWIQSSLMSRFNDRRTGQMLIVAQRLHQDDVCGMLLEAGGWELLSIPAIATEPLTYDIGRGRQYHRPEGELLHPVRETLAQLNQLRADLGSRRFEAQYQQQPTPPDGAIFKRAWLRYLDGLYVKQPGDRIIQSWDMAAKPGDSNDCSVCITAVVRRSQVIVIDVFRGRLSFPDLKKKVIALARDYKPLKLLIEDASAGIQMIQTLQTEQPAGVPLPIAIKPEKDKITRADRAAARVENGSLLLPSHAPWLDGLVNEMMAFPAGRHDDQVDALAHLLIHTEAGLMPRFAPEITFTAGTLEPDLMHQMIGDRS